MAENTYGDPPIVFGDKTSESEYQRKQRETTRRLLEATESENTYEFLVKVIYGEDFAVPVRLLDTKAEAYCRRVPELIEAVALVDSYNEFVAVWKGRLALRVHWRVPCWTQQASNYNGKDPQRKYENRERESMYSQIERTLEPAKADEFDRDHLEYVRAWWD